MSGTSNAPNPLSLPDGVRIVTNAAGCAAIFLAGHRGLSRWRAVATLRPPLDTSEELDRSDSPNDDNDSARNKARKSEEAEIEATLDTDSTGAGGKSIEKRRSGNMAEGSTVDSDGAPLLYPGKPSNGTPEIKDKDGAVIDPKQKKGTSKLRSIMLISFMVIFLAVFIAMGLFFLGALPEWAHVPMTWIYSLPMIYMLTAWYTETTYAIAPIKSSVRLRHSKERDSKTPYHLFYEYLEQDGTFKYKGPATTGVSDKSTSSPTPIRFWYRTSTRSVIGAVISLASLASAYGGHMEYAPFLVFATVTVLLTSSIGSFGKCWKLKWTFYAMGGFIGLSLLPILVVSLFPSKSQDKPAKDKGNFPIDSWLVPISSAGSLALQYILAGSLVAMYQRYEDSLHSPLTRFRAPGEPARVVRFESTRHPRSASMILALFIYFRFVAWLEKAYPLKEGQKENPFILIEFLGGAIMVAIIQLGLSIWNSEVKAWWNYTEVWCPSSALPIEEEAKSGDSWTSDVKGTGAGLPKI